MDTLQVVLRAIASLVVVVGLIMWLSRRFADAERNPGIRRGTPTRRRIGRCFLTVSTPLGTDIVHPREARQPVTHPGCRTPHAVQQGPTRRG